MIKRDDYTNEWVVDNIDVNSEWWWEFYKEWSCKTKLEISNSSMGDIALDLEDTFKTFKFGQPSGDNTIKSWFVKGTIVNDIGVYFAISVFILYEQMYGEYK